MADRRAKGMCMFCDEPFTPGRHLKHRRSQLMVMELDDDDYCIPEIEQLSVPVPAEHPQLSLQALTG
ncbi:hypothetical protein A2U01_0094990, partial [Trifolium medium]|nr:hypothetical protein [Trifolium medium]